MAIFGIITSGFGNDDEYYVGEDDVLFDWLIANNYSPSKLWDHYTVPVPEGYRLHKGYIVSEETLKADEVDETDTNDVLNVTVGSPENDKALVLLESVMKRVEPDEFDALEIEDERILDYMIY